MPSLHLSQKMIDFFYPVGSYYETSNTSFNPNTSWGGTWVEDSKGRSTIGFDSNQTEFNSVGKTGGEKTHTLTINEIPSHAHYTSNYNGGGKTQNNPTTNAGVHGDQNYWNFYNAGLSNYVGGGNSHNNLQPYVVVKRWHRTA